MAKKTKTKTSTEQKSTQGQKVKRDRHEQVLDIIKNADKTMNDSHFVLAASLSEAYNAGYYHKYWGYDEGQAGFDAFITKDLNIEYRKARYLINIHEFMATYGIQADMLSKLGWTKMKEIAAIATDDNIDEWLEKAEAMSSRELIEAVKIARAGGTGRQKDVVTKIVIMANETEATIILDALNHAKSLTENANDTVAFGLICQDWLEAQGDIKSLVPLETHVKHLESVYGVALRVSGENNPLDAISADPDDQEDPTGGDTDTTVGETVEEKATKKAGKKAVGKSTKKKASKKSGKKAAKEEDPADDIDDSSDSDTADSVDAIDSILDDIIDGGGDDGDADPVAEKQTKKNSGKESGKRADKKKSSKKSGKKATKKKAPIIVDEDDDDLLGEDDIDDLMDYNDDDITDDDLDSILNS